MSTDARPHFTAVSAALDAECTAPVYGYDKVPGTNGNTGSPPANFVLLSVERRHNPQLRSTATTGRTGWRVSVRAVAKTIGSAELLLFQVATALNEQRLTVDAKSTTPIQFESAVAAAWDDGYYAASALYTYAI